MNQPTRRASAATLWFAGSAAVFALVTLLVANGVTEEWPDRPVDRWVSTNLAPETRHEVFEGFLSFPGDAVPRLVVLALGIGGLLALRAWRSAAVALVAAGAVTTLTAVVKEAIERPRPLDAGENAYPSGHASLGVAYYGVCAVLLFNAWTRARSPGRPPGPLPWWIPDGLVVLALVVGLGRVLGGVHHPTDVLGGVALGATSVSGALWTDRILAGPARHRVHAPENV